MPGLLHCRLVCTISGEKSTAIPVFVPLHKRYLFFPLASFKIFSFVIFKRFDYDVPWFPSSCVWSLPPTRKSPVLTVALLLIAEGFCASFTGRPVQSGICTFSSWSLLFPAQSHPFIGQPGTFSLLLHLLDNKGLRSHHYPLAFVGDLSVKVDSSGSSGSLDGHLSTAMFPAAVLTQDLIRDPHCF